ncbi:extracellular elastinolytic metalloproteinase [Fistulifera solaris]|uniref:subtilisin n=1 Tax=Fistulifera solaris TaxID=1519565 RepID=A0A1Z5KRE5_FISSO|nr:extracellular elastinolytic metalloproteinase [Fistulifera solaris]|eukprot:GAX28876.1 extracellular elastinolytic metalloproteinase [Fistulifera solaris]
MMKAALLLLLGAQSVASASLRHRKLERTLAENRIDEQYIVVLHESVDVKSKVSALKTKLPNCEINFTYEEETFHGVSLGKVSERQLSDLLEDPDVVFVEEDQFIDTRMEQGYPTWGLDRLDDASLPLDNSYTYQYTGKGVKAFVIDTGIDPHSDLRNPSCGYTAYSNCIDEQGHGTHVAGTIGGSKYGVAKDVELVAVRVMGPDGRGSTSGLLSGLDYVYQQKKNNPRQPMVANMSLGGAYSRALNNIVENIANAGVFFAVAAGNSNSNACWNSPASAKGVVTVASSNHNDIRSGFSNYGSCVDIFAPGEAIESTLPGNRVGLMSGTSMATPHVAGVAALYLEANPTWSAHQVWNAMQADAISGMINDSGPGTPNRLLSTQNIGSTKAAPVAAPVPAPVATPVAAPVQPPSQCKATFSKCQQSSECCKKKCSYGFCWVW